MKTFKLENFSIRSGAARRAAAAPRRGRASPDARRGPAMPPTSELLAPVQRETRAASALYKIRQQQGRELATGYAEQPAELIREHDTTPRVLAGEGWEERMRTGTPRLQAPQRALARSAPCQGLHACCGRLCQCRAGGRRHWSTCPAGQYWRAGWRSVLRGRGNARRIHRLSAKRSPRTDEHGT